MNGKDQQSSIQLLLPSVNAHGMPTRTGKDSSSALWMRIHLRVQTEPALKILGGVYLDSNPTNKEIGTRHQKMVNKVKEIQDCGEECNISTISKTLLKRTAHPIIDWKSTCTVIIQQY